MAYASGNEIAINKTFMDKKKIEAAYADSVKAGFHPSNGNKTAMEAVALHEMGHVLTTQAGINIGKMEKTGTLTIGAAANRIVNEARRMTSHRGVVQMSSRISRYATKSNAEAVAEAFADVRSNGARAAAESKAIVQVLDSYVKGF